jgi:hypothetical protein
MFRLTPPDAVTLEGLDGGIFVTNIFTINPIGYAGFEIGLKDEADLFHD